MEKYRDMEKAKRWDVCCCKCYWNDQCCMGCNVEQVECDDFTPLYEDGVDELDYIEQEYLRDLETEKDGMYTWSDSITETWLSGEDVSGNEWWNDIEGKYDGCKEIARESSK